VDKYQGKGYAVQQKSGDLVVQIFPEKIRISSEKELVISKKEDSKYTGFSIFLNSDLYDFVKITNEIILWETAFGEAPQENLMFRYQDYNVEKHTQSDDTKIYQITNLNTEDKFQFASRSLIYPSGVV
jgi:hypothetical protein